MEFTLGQYEFKQFGQNTWQKVCEKTVMEKLVDYFDPVSPALSRMMGGEEITSSHGIYRKISN